MYSQSIEQAFSQVNARTEDSDSLIENFIPPDIFWKMFNTSHHVLLGSRGSGKTTFTKMASFPYLSKLDDPNAKQLVKELRYIGVFVSTDIRFVGSLRNKVWTDERMEETYFLWKFNVTCLKALTITVDSILDHLFGDRAERFAIERAIVRELSQAFLGECLDVRLSDLDNEIACYETVKRNEINRRFLSGDVGDLIIADAFSAEIFEPIDHAIRIISKHLPQLKKTNWLMCVDEAEFLTENHQRILNSYMRANPGQIFLKMATMPFHHLTLETNLNVHLRRPDDFDYINLDSDPIYDLNAREQRIYKFARDLYSKRVDHFLKHHPEIVPDHEVERLRNLDKVLGASILEANKPVPRKTKEALVLLAGHLDPRTMERARRLKSDKVRFGDQVWRKVTGLIYLREDKKQATGNKQMVSYSGTEIAIRCTDGVPRIMLHLFQEITREALKNIHKQGLRRAPYSLRRRSVLSRKAQSRLLKSFSEKRYIYCLSVPKKGPELRSLIDRIGGFLEHSLHRERISTDVIGSFRVDADTSEALWAIIKAGVAHGFIFPNTNDRQQPLVEKKGSFRLSFSLAPKFNLYPRRGAARKLQGMLRAVRRHTPDEDKRQNQRSFEF